MPRIHAPSVAEHRVLQRRALLDAAREIMTETGEPPSMGQLGHRIGLARSSVYQYFASTEHLLREVVADVFPGWIAGVHDRVLAASTPGSRAWAYIEANILLLASPERAVAQALSKTADPQALYPSMRDFHAQLQAPLRHALNDLGEPEPDVVAALIDSLILQSTYHPGNLHALEQDELRSRSLARLRRLLAGYLHLPPESAEGDAIPF